MLWLIIISVCIILVCANGGGEALGAMIGGIIAFVIIGGLALGIFLYIHETNSNRLQNHVQVALKYDTKGCPKDYPLNILITNNSRKSVSEVNWGIKVHHPGHSTDLTSYTSYKSDQILSPQTSTCGCWRLPNLDVQYEYLNKNKNKQKKKPWEDYKTQIDPDKLVYEVSYKHSYFK
jgi:hypothetical protein